MSAERVPARPGKPWTACVQQADGLGWVFKVEGHGMETRTFWRPTRAWADRSARRLVQQCVESDRRARDAHYIVGES